MVRLFQAGDTEAFAELYERYKTVALRSAYLLCGNYCDSENVLQEAFLKCYQHLPGLRRPERFKPWFFRILTRTAWDYCRRLSRECPMEYILEAYQAREGEGQAPLELLAAAEERRELAAAIDRLPLKQKTVVVLYYYNELSVAEIAGICGTLPGTVKSRLFAARRNLQRLLEPRGEGEAGGQDDRLDDKGLNDINDEKGKKAEKAGGNRGGLQNELRRQA